MTPTGQRIIEALEGGEMTRHTISLFLSVPDATVRNMLGKLIRCGRVAKVYLGRQQWSYRIATNPETENSGR